MRIPFVGNRVCSISLFHWAFFLFSFVAFMRHCCFILFFLFLSEPVMIISFELCVSMGRMPHLWLKMLHFSIIFTISKDSAAFLYEIAFMIQHVKSHNYAWWLCMFRSYWTHFWKTINNIANNIQQYFFVARKYVDVPNFLFAGNTLAEANNFYRII